ncbi:uncharacterized protein LOC143023775 [Oratosquilla oratoria]|uniref:uncharacterized protein LOC143023775 n=1 Tax=Oratosquilla oratoria TaxID=337810 RepID=UPI003F7753AC
MSVSYEKLWCDCKGDPNATHPSTILEQKIQRLHEGAKEQALWYIGVVVTLYIIGLVVIISRSDRHQRSATLSLANCFRTESTRSYPPRRNTGRSHHHHHHHSSLGPTCSSSGLPSTSKRPASSLVVTKPILENPSELLEDSVVTSMTCA